MLLSVIQLLREFVTFPEENSEKFLEDQIMELQTMEEFSEFSDRLREKLIADATSANLEVKKKLGNYAEISQIKAMATVKLFEFKLSDPVWKPTPIVGTVTLLLHKPTKGLFFQITDHKVKKNGGKK